MNFKGDIIVVYLSQNSQEGATASGLSEENVGSPVQEENLSRCETFAGNAQHYKEKCAELQGARPAPGSGGTRWPGGALAQERGPSCGGQASQPVQEQGKLGHFSEKVLNWGDVVSLLRVRAPAHSPWRGVGLLPCCQNPGCHDRLGDCCCPWCVLGNITAGRTLVAHMSVVLWVEVADGDGSAREAGYATPVAEAAAGLSPLPHREMASLPAPHSLPPLPGKWQKGAEIYQPGNSVRRRALLARCAGCSWRGDRMAKDWTHGGPWAPPQGFFFATKLYSFCWVLEVEGSHGATATFASLWWCGRWHHPFPSIPQESRHSSPTSAPEPRSWDAPYWLMGINRCV